MDNIFTECVMNDLNTTYKVSNYYNMPESEVIGWLGNDLWDQIRLALYWDEWLEPACFLAEDEELVKLEGYKREYYATSYGRVVWREEKEIYGQVIERYKERNSSYKTTVKKSREVVALEKAGGGKSSVPLCNLIGHCFFPEIDATHFYPIDPTEKPSIHNLTTIKPKDQTDFILHDEPFPQK